MLLSPFDLPDRWFCPAPPPARVAWLRGRTFAHRGLHGPGLAENSPAAFAAAIGRGIGIECDVQRTADGQAVVFHDWTLDRLTRRMGLVRALHSAELRKVRLKEGADTIPDLPQVLAQVAGQVPLLIEVKSSRDLPVEPLCQPVRDALTGYRGDVGVMSFDPRVVRWFRTHAPQVVRGLVVTEEGHRGLSGRLGRHWALWLGLPEFLAYDIRDLPGRFPARQRRRGLPLLTWTVRDPDLMDRALHHADSPIAEGAGLVSTGIDA